ncbi:MAG: hypothetical protein AAF512_05305 [Pseudomonadota bacterium]
MSNKSKPIGSVALIVNAPAQAEASDGSVRPLKIGDVIYETDIVSTSARGLARLQLHNGQVIKLGPSFRVSLDGYAFKNA